GGKIYGAAERTGGTVLRTSGTTGTNHPYPLGHPAYSMRLACNVRLHMAWNMRQG
ncbi:MAG: hypothetical protein HZA70_04015, partial [Planctomycetes bacterium]|nr:hypothetical protein [Planctomycetota bacterium]